LARAIDPPPVGPTQADLYEPSARLDVSDDDVKCDDQGNCYPVDDSYLVVPVRGGFGWYVWVGG
jgi:hypothetical protein